MKADAFHHPKMLALKRRLGKDHPSTFGIVSSILWFAGQYAIDGNLAKYTPEHICSVIDYPGDPDALFAALIEVGWLDKRGKKLIVHDWSEHADDRVQLKVARARIRFADGKMPKMSRLAQDERSAIVAHYESKGDPCTRRVHGKRTAGTPSSPLLSSPVLPTPDLSCPVPPHPVPPGEAAPVAGGDGTATEQAAAEKVTFESRGLDGRSGSENKNLRERLEIEQLLRRVGVNGQAPIQAMRRPDITLERVKAEIADIERDATVENLPAVLVKRLGLAGAKQVDGAPLATVMPALARKHGLTAADERRAAKRAKEFSEPDEPLPNPLAEVKA